MADIQRNKDPLKGPSDGVSADIQCAVTQYDRFREKRCSKKGTEQYIKSHGNMPCTVYCSYGGGTVGISIRELDMQIDVRLDELMAIMKAGAEAAHTFKDSLPQEYVDAELEARWRELRDTPFDEADSPSGLILSEAWWIFPKGADRGDIQEHIVGNHSKGVNFMFEITE